MKFLEFRIAPMENWYSYELPEYNLTELIEWCDNHRSDFNYSIYCIKPLKDKIEYKHLWTRYDFATFYFENEADRNWFLLRWS